MYTKERGETICCTKLSVYLHYISAVCARWDKNLKLLANGMGSPLCTPSQSHQPLNDVGVQIPTQLRRDICRFLSPVSTPAFRFKVLCWVASTFTACRLTAHAYTETAVQNRSENGKNDLHFSVSGNPQQKKKEKATDVSEFCSKTYARQSLSQFVHKLFFILNCLYHFKRWYCITLYRQGV